MVWLWAKLRRIRNLKFPIYDIQGMTSKSASWDIPREFQRTLRNFCHIFNCNGDLNFDKQIYIGLSCKNFWTIQNCHLRHKLRNKTWVCVVSDGILEFIPCTAISTYEYSLGSLVIEFSNATIHYIKHTRNVTNLKIFRIPFLFQIICPIDTKEVNFILTSYWNTGRLH